MEVAKSVMEKIGETFDSFEAKAFSMLSLSEQWRKLQSEFASVEASMARSENEEVEEEREVGGIVRRAVSLGKEVELRKQRVESEEKVLCERVKEEVDEVIELKDYWQVNENQRFVLRKFEEELSLREERIRERFEEVEVKEKKMNEVFLECQRVLEVKKEELVAKHRGLAIQEKRLIEQSEMLELKAEHMMEERKELVVKEKEVSEGLREVEVMKKEIDERCRVIELKRKEVDDRFRGVELKEEQVRECSKKVDLMKEEVGRREKELSEGVCELELRRKEVDDRFRGVKLKEEEMTKMRVCSKGVRLMKEEVKRKEKEVNERVRELELKEKQIMACRKGLELIEKELDERFRVVELKEKEISEGVEGKRINVCHSGLELIMKEIDERFEAVELREKEMIGGFRALELKKKEMDERCKSLELKEKEVGECLEAVKLRETKVSDGTEAVEVKVKELEDCCKVLDEKEKDLSSCRKSLESREQSLVLREQSINELCQGLELKEKQINEQSQSLEVKKKKLNKGLQALELQKKKIDKEYSVMKLKKKEVDDRFKAVEVKEKQIRRRRRVLDWREQQFKECCNAPESEDKQTKEESFRTTTAVASPSISFFNDIQSLCSNMNAKGLRSYMLKHVKEHNTMNDNMLDDSLWLASDPAKLVLDVIQSLNELEFEEVSMKNLVGGCILLLVQLMKLSADISSHVKDEAREFTDNWRSLLKQISSPMENFGYLQYLASFKMTENHNADELLTLFTHLCDEPEVYLPEQIPVLCDALGLRGEITDLIRSFISGDKQLQAVRYICTLKMENDFPLAPLLKAHLDNIHDRIEEILKIGNRNRTAQDDAAFVEVTALKEVLQCISNFKLESSYSPVSLELRIKLLEKEREERKKAAAHMSTIKRCSNSGKERVEEMPKSSDPSVLSSDNQSGKKRPANSEGYPKEAKHPRMHTHHGLMPYNPIRPPAHVWPYQFPVRMHQTLAPVSWHSYRLGLHPPRYDVPYNTRAGTLGVFGYL